MMSDVPELNCLVLTATHQGVVIYKEYFLDVV